MLDLQHSIYCAVTQIVQLSTTTIQILSEADPGGDMIPSWVYPAGFSSFGPESQGEVCSCKPCVVLTHLYLSLQLTPIISDPEYLLDQHILISIKSSDSDESYGKCLALKFWMSQNLLRFFQTTERVGETRSNSYRLNIYDLELNIHRNIHSLWAKFCEVIMIKGI